MSTRNNAVREKEIFEKALDIESPKERLDYVKEACGDNAALLTRVQALRLHDRIRQREGQ